MMFVQGIRFEPLELEVYVEQLRDRLHVMGRDGECLMRNIDGEPYHTIGASFGIHRVRARQLALRALRRIRKDLQEGDHA